MFVDYNTDKPTSKSWTRDFFEVRSDEISFFLTSGLPMLSNIADNTTNVRRL